jgi:hypothetical protein
MGTGYVNPLLRTSRFLHRKADTSSAGWSALTPGQRGWESFYRDRWQHDKVMRRSSPLARACSRRNDRARVVASVTDVPVTQTPPMHVTARVCGGSKRDRGARGTDCAGRRIAT